MRYKRLKKEEILNNLKNVYNCINSEDYLKSGIRNLWFKCSNCGGKYLSSYNNRVSKNRHTCPNCSSVRSKESKKISKKTLKSIGVLNPEDYVNSKTKNLKLKCSNCGCVILKSWDKITDGKIICSKCARIKGQAYKKLSKIELENAGVLNPEDYINSNTINLQIKCKTCGKLFIKSWNNIKNNSGKCKSCASKKSQAYLKPTFDKLKTFGVLNPEDYITAKERNLKVKCSCNNIFTTSWDSLIHSKRLCKSCSNKESKGEKEVLAYIKSIYTEKIINNDRNIIKPLELDIYLPNHNFAIEYNGEYWHSTKYKNNNYHYTKFKMCKTKNIKLFTIWDSVWCNKKDIVKSMLKSQLGLIDLKIFARKTKVRYLSIQEAKEFYENNHLQGYTVASVHLGLIYNSTIVACMSFLKVNENTYNLVRFTNKINLQVVGGASKLLKFFRSKYKVNIITFSDNSYSPEGNLYKLLGFIKISDLKPDYKYFKGNTFYHKFGFRHSSMKYKLENYNPKLSESENMENNGYIKVYDCGKIKWLLKQ